MFGLLDCFGGTLFHRGLEGKFNSETYQDFLAWVLTQTTKQLIVIQDNVSYHTSAPMKRFYADNTDRLTIYQLPAYSPDLNPIEAIWRKIKKDSTHLKWFPLFTGLVTEVCRSLTKFAESPDELTSVMGEYRFLTLTTG